MGSARETARGACHLRQEEEVAVAPLLITMVGPWALQARGTCVNLPRQKSGDGGTESIHQAISKHVCTLPKTQARTRPRQQPSSYCRRQKLPPGSSCRQQLLQRAHQRSNSQCITKGVLARTARDASPHPAAAAAQQLPRPPVAPARPPEPGRVQRARRPAAG